MSIRNTTNQNRSKQLRLGSEHVLPLHHVGSEAVVRYLEFLRSLSHRKEEILFSIGVQLLGPHPSDAAKSFLGDYNYSVVDVGNPPKDFDVLGSAYQYLNSKRENLAKGAFYTGSEVADDFLKDLDFSAGQTIFDPSCGSGVFLFRSNAPAENLVGVDSDPLAVMIAKFNYFIKFPEGPEPAIFCEDFFSWVTKNPESRFDYVIGNPPYGADLDLSRIPPSPIQSGESFSFFLDFSAHFLKENGLLRFLVPEALLNVKRHSDIRNLLLNQMNLVRLKKYESRFSRVMSTVYLVEVSKGETSDVIFENGTQARIPKDIFRQLKNQVFVFLDEADVSIIRKVEERAQENLAKSVFGLGVVTGDNKSKLHSHPGPGLEAIYTGKEVEKYRLLTAKKYLRFERSELQQVAPDSIYRAPEKLVYKVISYQLKFALDTTGSLTTNSANILIPRVEGLSAITVMGLLNSRLYSYLHFKLFGGVNKVAKENLSALPLPALTKEEFEELERLCGLAIETGSDDGVENFVARLFRLSNEEVGHIEEVVSRL